MIEADSSVTHKPYIGSLLFILFTSVKVQIKNGDSIKNLSSIYGYLIYYILILFFIFTINFTISSLASETFGDAMNWYKNNDANTTPRQNYILGLNAQEKGHNLEAISFFRKASKGDINSAKTRLVFILLSLGGLENQLEAQKLLIELSEKNDLNAINRLAWMYEKGVAGPSNLKKSQLLYKKAVSLGSNECLLLLSNLALKGVNGEPNIIEAISYSIMASRKNVRGASKLFDSLMKFIKGNEWDEVEITIASLESEIKKLINN